MVVLLFWVCRSCGICACHWN